MLEKTSKEVEPRIREQLTQSVARVTEDFEAAATRVSDRQLVRLMEDKLMVTREATAQMDASSAGARAQLQSLRARRWRSSSASRKCRWT